MHGEVLFCHKEPVKGKKFVHFVLKSLDARAGSLWHKRAGTSNSSDLTSTLSGPVWVKVNDEVYQTYFHLFSSELMQTVELLGQADISYVGFGPSNLTPAPPVGFNLTFICPDGQGCISSILIGRAPTILRSHWSRGSEC